MAVFLRGPDNPAHCSPSGGRPWTAADLEGAIDENGLPPSRGKTDREAVR